MTPDALSRRTIGFVNLAHALDHFVLLIYPTAVIAVAAEQGLSYAALIGLSTGAFLAFGLFSLPFGWLADRVGRRNLLAAFFLGCGGSCLALATARTSASFAIWLFVLGIFSAIYHPVGTAMLVSNARRLGRDLGVNGVWGNLGAAFASGITAFIAATWGWRASFVVPGLVCLAAGGVFIALVPSDKGSGRKAEGGARTPLVPRSIALLVVFAAALIAGGMTYNIITITLPKVIDERLGMTLPLVLTGSLATGLFVFGAAAQLAVGRLMDHVSVPTLFVGLTILQPLGLGLAAMTTGLPMVAGLVVAIAAIFGQVVINDATVAHYVPPSFRSKAYGLRYFMGFASSATAVPLIATLYAADGFALVLGVAAAFGAVIAACALAFFLLSQKGSAPAAAE